MITVLCLNTLLFLPGYICAVSVIMYTHLSGVCTGMFQYNATTNIHKENTLRVVYYLTTLYVCYIKTRTAMCTATYMDILLFFIVLFGSKLTGEYYAGKV